MDKNNRPQGDHNTTSILSIHVTQDGQYFCTPDDLSRAGEVEAVIATGKAVLIPAGLDAGPSETEGLFALTAQKPNDAEEVITITSGDKKLLAAVDKKLLAELKERFSGKRLRVTHPIIKGIEHESGNNASVFIYASAGVSFFVARDRNRLLYADSLPADDFPTLLLNVNRIIVANKLGKTAIVCAGNNDKELAESFSDFFADITTLS